MKPRRVVGITAALQHWRPAHLGAGRRWRRCWRCSWTAHILLAQPLQVLPLGVQLAEQLAHRLRAAHRLQLARQLRSTRRVARHADGPPVFHPQVISCCLTRYVPALAAAPRECRMRPPHHHNPFPLEPEAQDRHTPAPTSASDSACALPGRSSQPATSRRAHGSPAWSASRALRKASRTS